MFLFFLATELKKSFMEVMELSTLEVAGWKYYYNEQAEQAKKKK